MTSRGYWLSKEFSNCNIFNMDRGDCSFEKKFLARYAINAIKMKFRKYILFHKNSFLDPAALSIQFGSAY